MTSPCPCCGRNANATARAATGPDDRQGNRPLHWVDAELLAVINGAYAEAERRGAADVDLVHLMLALAASTVLVDLFEATRIDRRVLLAILAADADRDRDAATARATTKPRTGRDLRHLLDLAERTAAVYGSRVISVQDVVATMLAAPSTLDGASALQRWLWAARAYPAVGRITTSAVGAATASTFGTAAAVASASEVTNASTVALQEAAATSAAAAATVDSKVIRLKSRATDASDDLIDDEPLDAGQEPDPELEKLGVKRYYLSLDDEIVRAPSIGPRTAERLQPHGITHVKHLLACDAERLSARLGARHLTTSKILAWKHQARLVCTIPWLRGMHAQLLVGAGYASIEKILQTDRSQVCAAVTQFAMSRDGQSILRGATPPELDRIMRWIENSQQTEPSRAHWGKMAVN